jgi:hypothetical protein
LPSQTNLPRLITELRPRFDEYKDLLAKFGNGSMNYVEFAARIRRRAQGLDEDSDWGETDPDWR